jgi:hypothetical protein
VKGTDCTSCPIVPTALYWSVSSSHSGCYPSSKSAFWGPLKVRCCLCFMVFSFHLWHAEDGRSIHSVPQERKEVLKRFSFFGTSALVQLIKCGCSEVSIERIL